MLESYSVDFFEFASKSVNFPPKLFECGNLQRESEREDTSYEAKNE